MYSDDCKVKDKVIELSLLHCLVKTYFDKVEIKIFIPYIVPIRPSYSPFQRLATHLIIKNIQKIIRFIRSWMGEVGAPIKRLQGRLKSLTSVIISSLSLP